MCWIPFFSVNVVRAYMFWHSSDSWTHEWEIFFMFCTWLGYLNSCLNPIIYTLINRRFRASFMRTLYCGPEPDAAERRRQKCEQMRLLQEKGMQQRLININAPFGETEVKVAGKSSETNNSSDRYFSTDGVDLQEVRLQQQDTFL